MARNHRGSLILAATVTVAILVSATVALAQTQPTPAAGQRFALPLSDGTQGQAFFLVGPDRTAYLVYATPGGQLVVLTIGGQNPQPPVPPQPTIHKRFVIIENPASTTPSQRAILADPMWRKTTLERRTFAGIIPHDAIDSETGEQPTRFAAALRTAAGQPMPIIVWLNDDDSVAGTTPLPDTKEATRSLLSP
jgi:hypothetical protein